MALFRSKFGIQRLVNLAKSCLDNLLTLALDLPRRPFPPHAHYHASLSFDVRNPQRLPLYKSGRPS